jgi:basic membrane lipoprotein Med (substrate-binding protein (PBP1-ABC) superfamily)
MGTGTARHYYQEALKQGQKAYRNAVHRGQYPYIQALGQVEAGYTTLSRVPLGTLEIPIYLIAGSTEQQRCSSFSPGFYPLLDSGSEFADKWIQLCSAQLEEGIRDPIQCYEYLGRFYVVEGNKRVSVLQTLGAQEISAQVIRLLPKGDGLTAEIYREFLEFYKRSRLYGIHFSDLGCYARLQSALGLGPSEVWTDEFRRTFQERFLTFRSWFYRLGGEELGMTTADALLHWLQFYSAADFLSIEDLDEYRQTLMTIWPTLEASADEDSVDVNLEPEAEPKSRDHKRKCLHVAFLFQKTPEESPWTAAHDAGRKYLEENLQDQVAVRCYYNVTPENAEGHMQLAVLDGAEMIFATTVSLLDAALRAAVQYPKVQIMSCTIDQRYINVRSYYSRVYEGKFITGAIAGALNKSGPIGYVGSYPILGVPASINAFALGATLTNPDAKILLKWHCLPGDPMAEFQQMGITIVSDRDNNGLHHGGAMGLCRFDGDQVVSLASPRWNWGVFYVRMVQQYLWSRRYEKGDADSRAVNYWWGMSSGVVDLDLAENLPEDTKALARILKQGVETGTIQPFQRRIVSQDGTLINDGSRSLTMDEILKIDWLCQSVEGRLPAYEELLPVARETVRLLGVDRDKIQD